MSPSRRRTVCRSIVMALSRGVSRREEGIRTMAKREMGKTTRVILNRFPFCLFPLFAMSFHSSLVDLVCEHLDFRAHFPSFLVGCQHPIVRMQMLELPGAIDFFSGGINETKKGHGSLHCLLGRILTQPAVGNRVGYIPSYSPQDNFLLKVPAFAVHTPTSLPSS